MKKVLACLILVCGCVVKVCAEPLPLVPNYTKEQTTKATTVQKTTEKTTPKGSEKSTQNTTKKTETQETEKAVIAKQSSSVEETVYKRYEEYFNKDNKSDDIEKRIMLKARQIESVSSKSSSYRVKNAMANIYITGESEPSFLSVLGAKDNFLGVDFGNGKRNYSVDKKENSIDIDGVYFY